MSTDPWTPEGEEVMDHSVTISDEEWPCSGAISINAYTLLVFWECTWLNMDQYHSLRQCGHRGWLVHAQGQDRLLIAWEPTLESKSIQRDPLLLLLNASIEVRRDRPGLLGYVAAKYLRESSDRKLALLAYWKITSIERARFFYLQETFSSHRGSIVHSEGDRVWVQWEPTWVYYDSLDPRKKEIYSNVYHDPSALLRRFHKNVVDYSSSLAVQGRLCFSVR